MTYDNQRLFDYLEHILQAIERINEYTQDIDEVNFLVNKMIQDAVIRNIEIIDEVSHNIEVNFVEFSNLHSDIPFSSAYQMRNAVSHGYFKIDMELVWKTIESDLPPLEIMIRDVISGLQ